MEPTPKEIQILFESLQSTMIQLLDLDPSGWHWIAEAQKRVLEIKMAGVMEEEKRAG